VVAQDRIDRQRQGRQAFTQMRIGLRVAVVGQVACHHDRLGVGLARKQMRNGVLQALLGVGALQLATIGDEMGVRLMDELHRGSPT
jgi:hypothetical protein